MTHNKYRLQRIAHWNRVAEDFQLSVFSKCYQKLLCRYYKFFIPPGLRILELGSGEGNLLHSLQPAYGLGIDFSSNMVSKASFRYPELKFIFMSGYTVETINNKDLSNNEVNFISKPIMPDKLLKKIREVLDK